MKYLFSNSKAILFCLMLACSGAGFAQQTPPQKVNFQGRLTDLSDNPLNGTYDLTFSLYNAVEGGAALWTETQTGLTVANGALEAVLGSVTPIPFSVAQSSGVYLEMQVGSEVLAPRQPFNSVLYAMNAAALAGKNYDAFVDTYTAQSVSGIKTFRDNPVFNDSAIAQIKVSGLITALSAVAVDTTTLKSLVDGKQPLSANLTRLASNDGSQLTGVPSDGLGAHVATTTLNMANFPVINVSTLIVTNAVSAGYFMGNGAGLTGISGDNLGSHTATQALNMAGYAVNNISSITVGGGVTAEYFIGNGAGLTGISGADNLGSHIATQDLDLAGYGIVNMSSLTVSGDIAAMSYVGDGSRLTGISAAGDNLGDHMATAQLNMSNFPILNVSSVSALAFIGDGSLLTGITAAGDDLGSHMAAQNLNMGGFAIWNAGNVSITGQDFSVNGSTLVVTGGKMGIGTAVPGQNATAAYGRILHIYDDTPSVYPGIFIEDNDIAPGARWFMHAHGDGRNSFAIRDDVNAFEPLYIQDSNVGIGTDDYAPGARLNVLSSAPAAGSNIFMVSKGMPYSPTSLMVVKDDGKVGIGTSYPSYGLVVNGTAGEAGGLLAVSTGGASVILMDGAGNITADGSVTAGRFYGDGSGLTGITGGQGDNLGNHTATQTLDMSYNQIINVGSTTMTGPLSFSGVLGDIISGQDEHIAIMPTGAGNVGIGDVTPAEKLTVSGNIKAAGNLTVGVSPSTITIGDGAGDSVIYVPGNQGLVIRATRESYGNALAVQGYNAAKTAFFDRFVVSGASDTASVYVQNANFGIGTPTPDAKLTIMDGDIRLASSTYDHGIIFADGSYQTSAAASLWTLSAGSVYRETGNVGIGTMEPGALLDVYKSEDTGIAEQIASFSVGGLGSYLKFVNATAVDSLSHPAIEVAQYTDSGDVFTLNTTANSDAMIYGPMVVFNSGFGGTPMLRPLFELRNNSIRKLMVTGTGQVGVGTLFPLTGLPSANLHISSMTAATSQDMLKVSTGATGADVFVVKGSGNVGIGVAEPSEKLQVAGTVSATSFVGNGSGLTGISGDNLGNHTATQALQMGAYGINTSSHVSAVAYQTNGTTVLAVLSGIDSLGIGLGAGLVNTGNNNVFVGYRAGYSNMNGYSNTFLGQNAGYSNTTSENNTFVGQNAGYFNTGLMNSMLGTAAGYSNTTGSYNTLIGDYAGGYNQTGSANALFGFGAGGYGTGSANSFSSSTVAGYKAGYMLGNGSAGNILIGFQAGDSLTTGSNNIIIGYDQDATAPTISNEMNLGGVVWGRLQEGLIGIGKTNTLPEAVLDVKSTATAAAAMAQIWRNSGGTIVSSVSATGVITASKFVGDGSALTGIAGDNLGDHTATQNLNVGPYGVAAGYYQISGSTVLALLTGTGSLGVGVNAGRLNTGSYNVFVGSAAGYSNAAGFGNSFVGYLAGYSNTTGNANSFLGREAGYGNTTGGENTFLGYVAGTANTSGSWNSFVGNGAGLSNTTGSKNTLMGYDPGYYNQTGAANAIFGFEAGYGVINNSFSSATIMGYQAGYGLTTGSDNILLGFQAGDNLTTGARNIIIGYAQDATAPTISNELNIGGVIWGRLQDGLIGIGKTNTLPEAVLDVKSTATASAAMVQIWRDSGGTIVSSVSATGVMTASKGVITGTDFSVGGSTFVIKNGFVGIGTNNPVTPLFVQNASDVVAVLRTENSSKYTDLQMQSGTNMWAMVNNGKSDNALYFEWYNTGIAWNQYVTFLTNGNVGISTGTPQARLDVMAAGSTQSDMAQIWRDSGGAIVSSVSATGVMMANKFVGDGSGLTGVTVPGSTYTFTIGSAYGGGKIFWLDASGHHGLVAAASDQSTAMEFSTGSITTSATLDAVYAGGANTPQITTVLGAVGATTSAAKVCEDYGATVNNEYYADWYLPSYYELALLYAQKTAVGGFVSNFYWSSTEYSVTNAWRVDFTAGAAGDTAKSTQHYVRCVRSF